MRSARTFGAIVLLQVSPALGLAQDIRYINPLVGSNNGGNVFAGASLPWGMAKAVADVNGQNTGGFATDGSNITGFSHMHDSGTGGNPSLGNFPLFPQLCPENVLDNCNFTIESRATPYLNDSVVASPGYFAVTLASGIHAQMTVTEHTALYEFNFPESTTSNGTVLSPLIELDLTDLQQSRQNASVHVDASTGRITGNGTFLPSFGYGQYVLYYCADFAGGSVYDSGVYVNQRAGTYPKDLYVPHGFNLFYLESGGFVRFQRPANGTISARVGLSFISSEQACQLAEDEIPSYDFNATLKAAQSQWEAKLVPISVQAGGVNESLQTNFWSAIYRTMMSPQNYTGVNPIRPSNELYFDSYYCIWDSFRITRPLTTVIDPVTESQLLQGLLGIYEYQGWLPDCHMSLCEGWSQSGSNADVVFADAYVKNLTGIDWDLAYQALVKDAEDEPYEWFDKGRGGLMSWKSLKYIPIEDYDYIGFGTNSRSVSRTLEYAYDDFAVATVGKGLGKEYYQHLLNANNWRNLYKANQTSYINGNNTGFTGFLQPKNLNETWAYQDPIACSPLDGFCSLTSNPTATFESSIWEYQFFVPQDFAYLINQLGGPEAFISRLDFAFSSGLLDISNEPVFLTVFSYHYAGRPALSTLRAHSFIPSAFNATESGLPGNDDSGAMGAFIATMMMGLFPNAGQNVYLISPPFFESVSIVNGLTGNNATIRNINFDPTYRNIYIQSATLNGQPYTKNWIIHEFFTEGWTLELTLGDCESSWGTAPQDLPPSLSTSGMGYM